MRLSTPLRDYRYFRKRYIIGSRIVNNHVNNAQRLFGDKQAVQLAEELSSEYNVIEMRAMALSIRIKLGLSKTKNEEEISNE